MYQWTCTRDAELTVYGVSYSLARSLDLNAWRYILLLWGYLKNIVFVTKPNAANERVEELRYECSHCGTDVYDTHSLLKIFETRPVCILGESTNKHGIPFYMC